MLSRRWRKASRTMTAAGRWAAVAGLLAAACACATPVASGPAVPRNAAPAPSPRASLTYAALARRALATLARRYYAGAGEWHLCVPLRCATINRDWGADSLTYALYLHWVATGDPAVRPVMTSLTRTMSSKPYSWSDVPMWDSIAASREYQITHSAAALAKAKAAFSFDAARAGQAKFALGACPQVLYQQSHGGHDQLKTLETGSNYVKAALLLYQDTHQPGYLRKAEAQYAADRRFFLSRDVPLYSVYVFDNGRSCRQLAARYFGSVNGNMIWSGYYLAQATGRTVYLDQAVATAKAVSAHLSDAAGVYADLQAENDVTEPLVEAMYVLATAGHQPFARTWLLTAASASVSDLAPDGAYGRFFDGPPPTAIATAWQVNGGISLAFAAAALDPAGTPASTGAWSAATFVPDNQRLRNTPLKVTFTGRAVALVGTIGERCCQSGHARLLIDGRPAYDQTGIWQDKSSSGRPLPGSVLLAWRWPTPGRHTIEILPGIFNPKEGTSFFHMTGYDLVK